MSSKEFSELVTVVDKCIGGENSREIVEFQCKQMGITPDSFGKDDSALIVMGVMSSLSEQIPKEVWEQLDKEFKEYLSEEIVLKGKVKGVLFNGILEYFAIKRGILGLSELLLEIKYPTNFRTESWYPLEVMVELITAIENKYDGQNGSRVRNIGKFIISKYEFEQKYYWFAGSDKNTYDALMNIIELVEVDDFFIGRRGRSGFAISFKNAFSNYFYEFLLGVCDGINILRTNESDDIQVIIDNQDAVTKTSRVEVKA